MNRRGSACRVVDLHRRVVGVEPWAEGWRVLRLGEGLDLVRVGAGAAGAGVLYRDSGCIKRIISQGRAHGQVEGRTGAA